MRDYGKVHTAFWTSASIGELSEDGRMLALYLLTCPHGTIAGVFRIPDGYACEDLKWSQERVKQGFDELFRKGFSNRCETTKWVWVIKHFEWNPLENPNQKKSAIKVASQLPAACTWKSDFMRVCGPYMGMSEEDIHNHCETVSEGFLNQEQEQEQKQDTSSSLRSEEGRVAKSPAPSPSGRQKREKTTLAKYLADCREKGVKPVPDDHSIRTWAQDAGISDEMLQVAWVVFRERYTEDAEYKAKLYKDWVGTFANSVKGRWFSLWFTGEGGVVSWSSTGMQRKQVLDARVAKRKEDEKRKEQEAAHATA